MLPTSPCLRMYWEKHEQVERRDMILSLSYKDIHDRPNSVATRSSNGKQSFTRNIHNGLNANRLL